MEHLPKKIHQNGISYTLVGDYYIPDLELPEESRPIGRWGRMHKAFLQEHRPGQYNALLDRKSTRLNSSHPSRSRMPSSA